MSEKVNQQYKIAETFKTTDGLDVVNFERQACNPSRFEEFLAYQLHELGIKKIFGYKTEKIIGTGDAFDMETGKHKGKVTLQHYGFQKL